MNENDLPIHKTDIAAAERIVDAGMPSIEPILGGILEWMQDCNWPVAHVLYKVFDGMGVEVVPHIKRIFKSNDDIWKYWMIVSVVPQLSSAAKSELHEEIKRIAEHPTKGEVTEEVTLEAKEYLENEENL